MLTEYVGICTRACTGTTSVLGKAPLADLKSGLATAPTLFAAEEFPKLLTLIGRKFEAPGDVSFPPAVVLGVFFFWCDFMP